MSLCSTRDKQESWRNVLLLVRSSFGPGSDVPSSRRLCFVGIDNYVAGRMCGDLVKRALPDGGKIMIFVGRTEQDNARLRRQGLIDAVLGRSVDPERFSGKNGAWSMARNCIISPTTRDKKTTF